MSKKFSLLLVLAFCLAQVALVGFGTNASACHGSRQSETADNPRDSDRRQTRCSDPHDDDEDCDVEDVQEMPSVQLATTPPTDIPTPPIDQPTATSTSDQSATTDDSGYSVIVGAVGAGIIPTAIAGCIVGSLVVVKKRP